MNDYNIQSGLGYPSNQLSNFYPHKFIFDGVEISGMEGLLQSFKYSDIQQQRLMCTYSGRIAYYAAKDQQWWHTQQLYWNGIQYDRHGDHYQILLDHAYDALSSNVDFQKALLHTNHMNLIHTIGETNPNKTILTRDEFCSRLMNIRVKLQTSTLLEF